MAQEIEIRLAAQPNALASLARSSTLKRYARGPAARRHLNTVYYDTPEFALAKAGLYLRVRKTGRQFVQTVKGEDKGALANQRDEFECQLPSSVPDLRLIADEALRAKAIDIAGGETIEPKVETNIRRTTQILATDAGDEIEMAVDRGEIRTLAGGTMQALPVNEVELELRAGSPAALYGLAVSLAAETPFTVAVESKLERGLRALEGKLPQPRKAGTMMLAPDATAEEAFRATLLHCLRHISRNVASIAEARDPEGIHQIRVGLRRLRAALSAFGGVFASGELETLREEARDFAKEFGKTRELDVFALETLPPIEKAAKTVEGLSTLHIVLEDARAMGWDDTVALVSSPLFSRFLLRLAEFAEGRQWRDGAPPEKIMEFLRPAQEFAQEALKKRFKKAAKKAKDLEKMGDEDCHQLRLALKKLRYTAEFFAGLYPPKSVEMFLKPLNKLQDVFGALNDATATQAIIPHLIKQTPNGMSRAALEEASAFVTGWQRALIESEWMRAKKRWKKFVKSEAFWE